MENMELLGCHCAAYVISRDLLLSIAVIEGGGPGIACLETRPAVAMRKGGGRMSKMHLARFDPRDLSSW